MSDIKTIKTLLASVGLSFTEKKVNDTMVLNCDTSNQDGMVQVVFMKDKFRYTEFLPDGSDEDIQPSTLTNPGGSDYDTVHTILKAAPEEEGETLEMESPDGQYKGLGFFSAKSESIVAFVFMARTNKFLGLIGMI